jgi:putative redox protein
MGGYGIQIRKAEASARAIDPGDVIFKHHHAGHAQVRIETLTGGHLLHLAVAGCLFNDILRVAAERGITVNQLEVSADGDFDGEPAGSTGISYSVRIAGDAPKTSYAASSTTANRTPRIGNTLQRSTPVRAAAIHVHGM